VSTLNRPPLSTFSKYDAQLRTTELRAAGKESVEDLARQRFEEAAASSPEARLEARTYAFHEVLSAELDVIDRRRQPRRPERPAESPLNRWLLRIDRDANSFDEGTPLSALDIDEADQLPVAIKLWAAALANGREGYPASPLLRFSGDRSRRRSDCTVRRPSPTRVGVSRRSTPTSPMVMSCPRRMRVRCFDSCSARERVRLTARRRARRTRDVMRGAGLA
jgi:hypothetical protein